jgi:hypothetical protein
MHSKLVVLGVLAFFSLGAGNPIDHPAWMIGKWARIDVSEVPSSGNCPEPEFYGRNGYVTYAHGGGVDRWWIDGHYLIRVVVEPGDGESASEVGHAYKQGFTRTPSGGLVFRGDQWAQKLVRCGNVPREWEYMTTK